MELTMVLHRVRQTFFYALFFCECVVFIWIYTYGRHGYKTISGLRSDHKTHLETIAMHKTSIQNMQKEIITWNIHTIDRERFAREQLHMARKDEIVFYV